MQLNNKLLDRFADSIVDYMSKMENQDVDILNERYLFSLSMTSFVSTSLVKMQERGLENIKMMKQLFNMSEEELEKIFEKSDNFFKETEENMGILIIPCILMHDNDELIQFVSSSFNINSTDIKNIVSKFVQHIFDKERNIEELQTGGSLEEIKRFMMVALFILYIFSVAYIDNLYIGRLSAVWFKTKTSLSYSFFRNIHNYMKEGNICEEEIHENDQWGKFWSIAGDIANEQFLPLPENLASQLKCLIQHEDKSVYTLMKFNQTNTETNYEEVFEDITNAMIVSTQENQMIPIDDPEYNDKLQKINEKIRNEFTSLDTDEEMYEYLKKVYEKPEEQYIDEMMKTLVPEGYTFEEGKEEGDGEQQKVIVKQKGIIEQAKETIQYIGEQKPVQLVIALCNAVMQDISSSYRGNVASIAPWREYLRSIRNYQVDKFFELEHQKIEAKKTLMKIKNEMSDFIEDLNDTWKYGKWIVGINIIAAKLVVYLIQMYLSKRTPRMIEGNIPRIENISGGKKTMKRRRNKKKNYKTKRNNKNRLTRTKRRTRGRQMRGTRKI